MDLYQAILDLENSSVNEQISSVNLAVLGLINPLNLKFGENMDFINSFHFVEDFLR
jgi:hypothetical protein